MACVLITGGAGYIGSHVLMELSGSGHEVVVIDNLSTGHRNFVPESIPLVEGDVGDQQVVLDTLRTYGVTDVVHCAASLRVDESMRDPGKYWRNNVAASVSLVEACVEAEVQRFVFSSTAAVYGEGEGRPVTESYPPRPANVYGNTKRAVEMMLADMCRASGMKSVALRYFNVAGADPAGRLGASPSAEPSLIRIVCQAALGARREVSIFGTDYQTRDGTAVRDYVHVCDLAEAHAVLLESLDDEPPGTAIAVNCGYGGGITVREVIDSAYRVSGRAFPVREAARRPGDVAAMVADTQLLRGRYNWVPKHARLEQIIADTLSWERKLLVGAI